MGKAEPKGLDISLWLVVTHVPNYCLFANAWGRDWVYTECQVDAKSDQESGSEQESALCLHKGKANSYWYFAPSRQIPRRLCVSPPEPCISLGREWKCLQTPFFPKQLTVSSPVVLQTQVSSTRDSYFKIAQILSMYSDYSVFTRHWGRLASLPDLLWLFKGWGHGLVAPAWHSCSPDGLTM